MSLRHQLTEDMKSAMRARDQIRLDTVRFVLSQVKNAEIDLKREMTDEEIIKLLKKEVKNRQEAIEQYRQGGRDEIVAEEEAKLEVITAYLPAEMSDEDLRKIVEKHVALSEDKNFGKIIGSVMADVQGQADGGRVSQMIKQVLNS